MTRDETLRRLRAHEADFRAAGVAALYLFGSTARDEAGPDSDVDLFMDVAAEQRMTFFDQLDIEALASAELGLKVELSTRAGLHPLVLEDVKTYAIAVFA
jgi:uncharacterized protein